MNSSYRDGGKVVGRGGPRDDQVDARLSNGEYVIPADVVARLGSPFLNSLVDAFRRPTKHYADGGVVGSDPYGDLRSSLESQLNQVHGSPPTGPTSNPSLDDMRSSVEQQGNLQTHGRADIDRALATGGQPTGYASGGLVRDKDMDEFAAQYPEIIRNPHMATIADSHFEAGRAAGMAKPEALRHAGESTRAFIKRIAATHLGMTEQPRTKPRKGDPDALAASRTIAEMAASRPGAAIRARQEQD